RARHSTRTPPTSRTPYPSRGSPASPSHTRMRGLFVTGTGTGVGKTLVSAALLGAMRVTGGGPPAPRPPGAGRRDASSGGRAAALRPAGLPSLGGGTDRSGN